MSKNSKRPGTGRRSAVQLPMPAAGSVGVGTYDMMVRDKLATTTAVLEQGGATEIWDGEDGKAAELSCLALVLMPEEFDTLLFADQWSTDRICRKGILQKEPAPWTNQPDAELRHLPPEEYFFASFRGNGAWFRRTKRYFTNPNSEELRFRLKWAAERTSVAGTQQAGNPDFIHLMDGQNYFRFNIADCRDGAGGSTFATAVNTQTMVCGRSTATLGDHRWVWCNAVPAADAGDQSTWTITYSRTAALGGVFSNCTVVLSRWNAGNPKEMGRVSFVAAAAPNPNPDSGTITLTGAGPGGGVPDYYTFTYIGADDNFATGNGFRFDFVSKCAGLTQTPVENAFQNIFQLGKGTVIAASCRLTDMAAPLNIQGEATVAQVRDPYTWWYIYTSGGCFTRINNYRDSYTGKLLNGGYAYHLPFRGTQFEMTECMELDYDAQIINDVWFDIEDDSNVNVFGARSINAGNNNGQTGLGCDGWITTVTHFNWYTDNKWPDASYPDFGFTIWAEALTNLRFAPRVMSNNHHAATLFKWMFDTGKLAKKYYGPFKALIQRAAPIVNDGVKLLTSAYRDGQEITRTMQGGGM